MRRLFLQSILALTLFGSGSGADAASARKNAASPSSRPMPELTHALASRMTTAQLARLLLPDQPADRFVSHEVRKSSPHGEPLGTINFFHRPVPIGADLCRRDVTNAYFQPYGAWEPGKDSPVRFTRSGSAVQMAVAPRCRLKEGGYFGWVQPEGVDELAPQALRRLVALQAIVKAGRQLPIKVVCQSEDDAKACDKTASALIAALPLDRIFIIQPDQSGWAFSVMPDGPGQLYWNVTIHPEGIVGEQVVMRWGRPAPF